MSVEAAIRAQLDGSLSPAGLMRALMSHDGWIVPGRPGPDGSSVVPLIVSARGGAWLPVFTSESAWSAWTLASGAARLPLRFDGPGLAELLTDQLMGVDINAGTAEAIHFDTRAFEDLRRFANVGVVSQILLDLPRDAEDFRRLREHTWLVPTHETAPGQVTWMLAPDANRKMAAVFTGDDAAEAYVERIVPQTGIRPRIKQVPGAALFRTLAGLEIDAIVFDPAGPRPRGMLKRFAAEVVDSSEPESGV